MIKHIQIILISILTSVAFFSKASAQFKDLPSELGRINIDGFSISLWSSQDGKNIYFLPFISMDWRFFEEQNSILDGNNIKKFCRTNSDSSHVQEWTLKIDFWTERLRGKIIDEWNNSDRPIAYSNSFNDGKIDGPSLSMPPMNGYSISVALKNNEPIFIENNVLRLN